MNELWKEVPGFPGYEVSSLGRVFNARTSRMRKPSENRGYLYVTLTGGKSFTVHGLVAAAFLGVRKPGTVVNHLDSDRANNRVENLEWTTQKLNVRHGAARGSYGRQAVNYARYPRELRADLCRRVAAGESYSALAREIKTTPMQILRMVKREVTYDDR